jgi:hypothetical protein
MKKNKLRHTGSNEIDLLLSLLDEAYRRRAWHGTNLRGSIRGLTAKEAAWRPGPNRHNIWEIAIHAAYRKYAVRRRLLREKRGSFPLKGSNWIVRPEEASEKAWQSDLHMLDRMHSSMVEAIARIKPSSLARTPAGKKTASLLYGIACHDVYHAGQIQLIKKLMKR